MWTADAILAVALAACTVASVRWQDTAGLVVPALPGQALAPGTTPTVPTVPPIPPPPVEWAQQVGPVPSWHLVLAALTALPLVLRRRCPLTVYGAVIVTTLLLDQRLSGDTASVYPFLSCVIAAYGAAVYSPYRLRALTGLVVGAGLIALFPDENFLPFTPSMMPFLVLLGVGLGANALHVWKQRVHTLQEQQKAATGIAVDRERARIARELHDIVTHNVSVMVIQAGAARKVMDAAPDRAREALLAVEAGGRTAMAELRHVMGLLAPSGDDPDEADDPDLSPQPGVDRIPALVDRVRGTGVSVELTVTGTPSPLPAGADLAAYRVVQEALTNTVRHAAGARVRVALDHTPDALHIDVTCTGGAPAPAAGPGTGRGLLGLRERLALHEGTLDAGPLPVGGYGVHAVVPRSARTDRRP
ncbi:sensor histidine kinase [Streptomyces sp. NPDC003247]|uniref:sensor histidine kinase n=1 Tax=Streptomyces sp. NPDC003247 TaxID=3364677 RepID=UPI0036CFF50B